MNTIPSTFNEKIINSTVICDTEFSENARFPLSVLLLCRSAISYKEQILQTLVNFGFESIVTIQTSKSNFIVDNFAKKFPQVKFIIPQEKCNIGEMINIGMSEVKSDYLLVLWDDIVFKSTCISDLLMNRIISLNTLCVAPVISNSFSQTLPVQFIPSINKGQFSITPSQVLYDNTSTMYPFDFVGIYNREKFIQMGGYDYTLETPYWQNLDFSARSLLWGEKIVVSPAFRLSYAENEPITDTTVDSSYFQFYLKNIAPVYKTDYGYIPINLFFQYKRNSAYTWNKAYSLFKIARKWVSQNKFRFKFDIHQLIEQWERS